MKKTVLFMLLMCLCFSTYSQNADSAIMEAKKWYLTYTNENFIHLKAISSGWKPSIKWEEATVIECNNHQYVKVPYVSPMPVNDNSNGIRPKSDEFLYMQKLNDIYDCLFVSLTPMKKYKETNVQIIDLRIGLFYFRSIKEPQPIPTCDWYFSLKRER